ATETRKQGYGLGLSIAQGIALAHEGEIRVESELGQGTVFYVTLPRGLQPAREAQRPGAA
ncbi:MAG: ATP-binding protein, partial [Bdellovibrionota bacterium]